MENYLQSAPCIYFSCNDEGILIDVNDTACQKLGYEREELTGKKVEVIFTIASRIFQQTHFFPMLKMQGHAEEIYITLLTKQNQQLPVLINAIRNNGINMYAGIIVPNRKKFEDELIAAKKAAEAALYENKELAEARRQLQDRIEQVELQMQLAGKQNEELRQFNRVVTHDMQEPIRKLLMFVSMLSETEGNEQQKAIAGRIRRVSEQMRSVVSDLQQYIWLTETTGEYAEIEIKQVLSAAEQQVRTDFPGVELIIEAEALPSIQADADQLRLMFYHLLSNVIRFRKQGSAAHACISATSLMVNTFRNLKDKYKYNEVIKLTVADKGVGFDGERRNMLFGLFKRLHAESGRGVGLALCKRVVENHHGTINIDSRKDDGAIITVILPVKQVEAGAVELAAKEQ
jgi:phosphoserine phosphatase RsbU/P